MLDSRQFLLALAVGAYALPLGAQTTARAIHRVEIKDFAFEPSRIEVRAGDTLEWINRDFAPRRQPTTIIDGMGYCFPEKQGTRSLDDDAAR